MRVIALWDNSGNAPAGWESHVPILWDELEPAAGQYRFERIDRWLAANPRPVHLDLIFYMHDLIDHTAPAYRAPLTIAADGERGEMPPYASAAWRAAYVGAVRALVDRYRAQPQVVAFWLALGMDQETQPTAVRFAESVRPQLRAEDYYDFVLSTTREVVAAWQPKPVYIQAAPAPGTLWGRTARHVLAAALRSGARYKMNGWQIDQADSVGLGGAAGLMKIDLAQHAAGCALEPSDPGTDRPAGEMYWRLLRAAAHGVDFVALQPSWQAQALAALPQLPRGERWIVFRDREHAAQMWGKSGVSGEPGCWARGVELASAGAYTFTAGSVAADRWLFTSSSPLCLRLPGCTAERMRATVYDGSGAQILARLPVVAEAIQLPAGVYHRVDLQPDADPDPLAARLAEIEGRLERLEAWRKQVCA